MEDAIKNYKRYHQNPMNKLIHYVCVPMIFSSGLAILEEMYISSHWVCTMYQAGYIIHAPTYKSAGGLVIYLWILNFMIALEKHSECYPYE